MVNKNEVADTQKTSRRDNPSSSLFTANLRAFESFGWLWRQRPKKPPKVNNVPEILQKFVRMWLKNDISEETKNASSLIALDQVFKCDDQIKTFWKIGAVSFWDANFEPSSGNCRVDDVFHFVTFFFLKLKAERTSHCKFTRNGLKRHFAEKKWKDSQFDIRSWTGNLFNSKMKSSFLRPYF